MILADTSAWVEFDRATGSDVDHRLTELMASTDVLATTEPVIMEVLAGARDERRAKDLRRLLGRFELLRFDPVSDFEAAALIYRKARKAGITPRGMIDCMIVAVAFRTASVLLTLDTDLERVGALVGVATDLSRT